MASKMTEEERFWTKVQWKRPNEFGCWLWTAGTNYGDRSRGNGGYGWFRMSSVQKSVRAHCYSWFYFNGCWPSFLVHLCDKHYAPGDLTYRRCVNPHHLVIGDNKTNRIQQILTGRQAMKLTDSEVSSLCSEYAEGIVTQRQLAKAYRIGQSQVSRLVNGKRRGIVMQAD